MLRTRVKFENYSSSGLHYIGYGMKFEVPGGTIGDAGIFANLPADHAAAIKTAVLVKRPAMHMTDGETYEDGIYPDYMPFQKDNYEGTTTPGVTDDETDGYSVGSVWINVSATPHEAYRCVDASEGAAVWLNTTLEMNEIHTAGRDQGLDTGGPNAVTAAQVKTAVTNSHASGSDNQDLSGLATKVAASPDPSGKVAAFDSTGNIVVPTPGTAIPHASPVSGTATNNGYGFVSAEEMNAFISGVNAVKDAVNLAIGKLETRGLIATPT